MLLFLLKLSSSFDDPSDILFHAICQLKMLQETNRRLQDYNASLQQYNSNLQTEANKNGETISRLQKEKSAIMESLTSARDHSNSLKTQLDSSRVSVLFNIF